MRGSLWHRCRFPDKEMGKQPPRRSALLTHAASLHALSVHALRLWVEWDDTVRRALRFLSNEYLTRDLLASLSSPARTYTKLYGYAVTSPSGLGFYHRTRTVSWNVKGSGWASHAQVVRMYIIHPLRGCFDSPKQGGMSTNRMLCLDSMVYR